MREFILEELMDGTNLDVMTIILNNVVALIAALFIMFVYKITYSGVSYSRKFNVSLGAIAITTTMIMGVISNDIALSLGMVGALSIIRFRTAIKDSRDSIYIFWTIIVGICCGVGDYMVAAIGSTVTFLVILMLGMIKNDNRMLLIIRAAYNRQDVIQAYIFKTFHRKAVLRVRNTTETTVEFIYEISSNLLIKVEHENTGITNGIYALGGVEYVNIVMQNDEVSN